MKKPLAFPRFFPYYENFSVSAADLQLRIVQLEQELNWAQLKIQVLEERLRQRRIQMLGPHSETLNNLQLELLADEEQGVTAEEVEAEAQRDNSGAAPRTQAPSWTEAFARESASCRAGDWLPRQDVRGMWARDNRNRL